MKIKTVSYSRTKNLGNYESEKLEMSAEIEYDDDTEEVFYELKKWVTETLYPQIDDGDCSDLFEDNDEF
jgi:hypothetical protein